MKGKNIIGFESLTDFFQTTFGIASYKFTIWFSTFGGITGFITDYIYSDAKAVFILAGMLILDFLSGVTSSILDKSFSSSRLPRAFVILLTYCFLLSVSWTISKHFPVFTFLPATFYYGMVSTLSVSFIENIRQILKY